jgi:GNAT superfamily N-acetyltransferase
MMTASLSIELVADAAAKARLCVELSGQLPAWFGRPAANAMYAREMATRDAFAAKLDGHAVGLMAVEYLSGEDAGVCNIWWLGVAPAIHRMGVGRALIEHAVLHARVRNCANMSVETVGSKSLDVAYAKTRCFYEAMGFRAWREFEPEPGDFMLEMRRVLVERPERIALSERDSLTMLDLLDNPPEPTARLISSAKAGRTI